MSSEDDFFAHVAKEIGLHPSEARVLLQIAEGLRPELKDALRGTPVADDTNALLLLTRLSWDHQGKLVFYLNEGLLAELAVELLAAGVLTDMLDE